MNRIPKNAQRAIDAANRARQANPPSPTAKTLPQVPRRLDILKMPGPYCRGFDVFFDGVKQTLCQIADMDKGYIVRYMRGEWDATSRAFKPLAPYETEQLFGDVQIHPKGLIKQTRKPWDQAP